MHQKKKSLGHTLCFTDFSGHIFAECKKNHVVQVRGQNGQHDLSKINVLLK